MNLDAGRLVALNVLVDDNDANNLYNPRYVEGFLRELVSCIGMQILVEPMSIVVPPNPNALGDEHADDGGMTTQCVISTSHIAYHSWPLQRRFRLVVDSCKDFSAETVRDVMSAWFAVKGMSIEDAPYRAPQIFEAAHAEAATQ